MQASRFILAAKLMLKANFAYIPQYRTLFWCLLIPDRRPIQESAVLLQQAHTLSQQSAAAA
jgi:hypothetical protein